MLGKGLESLIPSHQNLGAGQARQGQNQGLGVRDQGADNKADERGKRISINQPNQHPPASASSAGERRAGKSAASQQDAIFHIEIDKIVPNPHQPRKNFSEETIRELASSIREFGILQPIVVTKIEKETPTGADVEYHLIAGERRVLAAKLLGLERIPAIVRNVDLERERLELAVIENIQREDLDPIERARAFSRLQDEFRMTQREIAARLGKSREAVANAVRLLDLPAAMQEALSKKEISESHGRLLLSIDDPAAQERLFRELLEKRMTTRDLKHRVRQLTAKPEDETAGETISPELKMLQEQLSSQLGAPVEIEHKGEKGKITITFYSPEELRNIVNRLEKED